MFGIKLKKSEKGLKEKLGEVELEVTRYTNNLIGEIEGDVRKVLFQLDTPVAKSAYDNCLNRGVFEGVSDWQSAERIQSATLRKAVADGELNPQKYLDKVNQDLKGPYHKQVFEAIKSKLKRDYLIQ